MRAAARPVVNHRGAAFRELYKQVTAELKNVFQTQGQVMSIAGSGTAAMVAGVVDLVSAGEMVLVVVGGEFGERWGQIARAAGAEVSGWRGDWGRGAEPEELAGRLAADPDSVAVV